MKPLNLYNMSEEVEITNEDNIMLLMLIASLNDNSYPAELDWEMLMSSLDVIHTMGAEICIIWGSSIYISMDDHYYNRVEAKDDLSLRIFNALHHFSLWYIKTKVHVESKT